MTVSGLKNILSEYPDDMEIKIGNGTKILSFDNVEPVVDIDTNVTSLVVHDSRFWPSTFTKKDDMDIKPLFYKVIVEGQAYYFSPYESNAAIELANRYWPLQLVYIGDDRMLRYCHYNWQENRFDD